MPISLLSPIADACVFVIGHTKQTPRELEISPTVVQVDPKGDSIIMVKCANPLFFLPPGHTINQALVLPKELPRDTKTSTVLWTEVVGKDKPMMTCNLHNGNSDISLTGMVDTGADVMVISYTKWPSQWERQPADGAIVGVGGSIAAERTKHVIQFEEPDGQIASVCPYVINSGFTLWGRDLMSQWGTRVDIPQKPQDF